MRVYLTHLEDTERFDVKEDNGEHYVEVKTLDELFDLLNETYIAICSNADERGFIEIGD